eukprot:6209225-Pleurochrysis_carterae.AAC.3
MDSFKRSVEWPCRECVRLHVGTHDYSLIGLSTNGNRIADPKAELLGRLHHEPCGWHVFAALDWGREAVQAVSFSPRRWQRRGGGERVAELQAREECRALDDPARDGIG